MIVGIIGPFQVIFCDKCRGLIKWSLNGNLQRIFLLMNGKVCECKILGSSKSLLNK